jgi:arsenite methyltransferase
MSDIREMVRERYAAAARSELEDSSAGCCVDCGCDEGGAFGAAQYDQAVRAEVGAGVAGASLGCGNPLAVADLHEGDTVLDLGSGAGIDLVLSSRRVGPTGKVYGLDMTEEMLALAQRNIDEAGVNNVELLHGVIEDIPLPDGSVDVVISNCVVNLSADKPRVFAEIARVLRPGGRIGITDVVADDELTPNERAERGSLVGCIAGALTFSDYRDGLAAAGLADVDITPTHAVADRMVSATIRATRP